MAERPKGATTLGGGQIDEQVTNFTGDDAYGKDDVEAVLLAKKGKDGR